MRHRPSSIRYRAIGMMEAGLAAREISSRLLVPTATLYRWFSRFRAEGEVERHPGSGRPPATSHRADRRIIRLARMNRFSSSTTLLRWWREPVSAWTVRRRLHRANLFARRPLRRPLLTAAHRRIRLGWAMARCHFRDNQWSRIVFSDESRFVLQPTDNRARVWRTSAEIPWQQFVSETTAYGGGSVMVWGAICSNGRSSLVIIRGSLRGESYRQLLSEHLLPWAEHLLGPRATHWRFQDDNAPPHRCTLVNQFVQESGIRRIDWPSRSPDLNPIEHVWDVLGRRVRARDPPPTSIAQLSIALQEEWLQISQGLIRRIVLSMPRRVHQVLQTRGGHTSY